MALLSDYTAGTISVAADGTAVTGVGTAWLTADFREGDLLFANGATGVVLSVNSNTSITLAQPWKGGVLNNAAYRLRYQGDNSRVTAQARQLIEMLGAGNITALSGLVGAADKLPYFTGPGTMGLATLTAFMRGLLDDADGATAYGTLGEIPNNQLPGRLRNAVSQTTDADALVQTGFYGCGGGANGIPVAVFGTILHLQYDSSTTAIQFYWRGTASNQRWMRRKVSNVWSAWVCNSEQLLGTVSQAGGVPTGAVIERGSNANGDYVRFADGTLICTRTTGITQTITTAVGSTFASSSEFIASFPATFVNTDIALAYSVASSSRWGMGRAFSATGYALRQWGAASSATEVSGAMMAVGRWF